MKASSSNDNGDNGDKEEPQNFGLLPKITTTDGPSIFHHLRSLSGAISCTIKLKVRKLDLLSFIDIRYCHFIWANSDKRPFNFKILKALNTYCNPMG
jgi:hypothetical protein